MPAEYATATRKAWTRQIRHGTFLEISGARAPAWVAENRDNPLREWDGRPHISASRYRKSVAQYKTTRRAVFTELTSSGNELDGSRFAELGRQFGEAFNQLNGTRNPFIETEERDDVFQALDTIIDDAETQYGRRLDTIRQHLRDGVEDIRDW